MAIGDCLSDAECHIILWVSCFPAFQPVIRIVAVQLDLRSSASTRGESNRPPKTLSRVTGSSTRDGQERLRSRDDNESTTHIMTNDGESDEGTEEIELGRLGEARVGKENIVKSTHIEIHTSPQDGR
jgi:hypothetical protein